MSDLFVPLHVECTGDVRVPAPLPRAFALFTPEGERTWVPGWDPEYLHPQDGRDRDGAVFRTRGASEETLWLIVTLDRERGAADYVRVTPGSRMGSVSIRSLAAAGFTTVRVTYRLTALSPDGNRVLEKFQTGFAGMLHDWESAVSAALRS